MVKSGYLVRYAAYHMRSRKLAERQEFGIGYDRR